MRVPDPNPYAAPTTAADAARPAVAARIAGPTRTRYRMLAWLCLAATIAYICRNSIGVAESTIRRDLGLTEKQMGSVMSAFFLTYALVQLPTGWLADVWGSRRMLPLCAVCWSLATAAMSLAHGFLILGVSRLANGVAQAGLFPGCTNSVSKWFPKTERAFASGALASFMSLGGAIGVLATGWLLDDWGLDWRWIFASFGLFGCLWAWGFYAWFRDLPEDHPGVGAEELALIREGEASAPPAASRPPVVSEPTPWAALLSSPAMWCICGQQFFRAAGNMFFASWFPTYLQEARGVSIKGSGLLTTLPLMAVVVGGLIGGAASDRILKRTHSRRLARQGVATVNLLACAAMIFAAYFIDDALLAVLVITVGTLFFALGGPTSYAITMDMGGRHVATVFSTMNMAGNVGAMLFPYFVPHFKEATGSWNSVLLLFGGMYVAAAVCWLLLNPNGTVFDYALVKSPSEKPQ